jgi:hypothetical protein
MAGMTWQTTGDVTAFLAAAGEHLRRERARNTVLLTVSEQVRLDPVRYAASPAGRLLIPCVPRPGRHT